MPKTANNDQFAVRRLLTLTFAASHPTILHDYPLK